MNLCPERLVTDRKPTYRKQRQLPQANHSPRKALSATTVSTLPTTTTSRELHFATYHEENNSFCFYPSRAARADRQSPTHFLVFTLQSFSVYRHASW
jgi:hypothetical protein